MKKFTKLTLTLAMLFGLVGGVKAESVSSDFSELAAEGASWNPTTHTMGWNSSYGNALSYFMFKGLTGSDGCYDLSLWETITIEFSLTGTTNGVRIRMKDNTGGDGDWIVMEGAGKHVLNISDFKKGGSALNYRKIMGIQLSGGNNTSTASTATFTEISLYCADLKEKARTNLANLITLANKQHRFGKTEDSFNALTSQISTADGVRSNVSATKEDLVSATTALQEKMDALQLLPGYSNLTLDQYKKWKQDGDAFVEDGAGPGQIRLFEALPSGNVPYGHIYGSGDWQNYAELSNYSKLYITGTPGERIRGYFNKSPEGAGVVDRTLVFDENGVAVFDFINDDGFSTADYIHLIFLKTPEANSGITSLLLYDGKHELRNALTVAGLQTSFAKTSESFAAIGSAVTAANMVINNRKASNEDISTANNNLINAMNDVELEIGYTNLTADMFKAHSGVDVDATVTGSTGCSYKLSTATDLPYGDSSVGEKNWADLASYDKLIIVTSGSVKPRLCMNRIEAGGNEASTKADSKMIDINDNYGNGWSEEAYLTTSGNIYTIDLQAIVSDWGFARLHSIKKQGWGDNVIVTDMLLYRTPKTATIGVAGYATFATDKAVKFEGVEAYVGKVNGNSLTLIPVTEAPANTAIILKGAADTYSFPVVDAASPVGDNDLKVSDGTVSGNGEIYILANKTNGVGFYKLSSGSTLPAGKAYLQIPSGSLAPEFIGFGFNMDTTTGINNVETVKKAANVIYNLNGQRVNKTAKGLYIVNGKKVAIK